MKVVRYRVFRSDISDVTFGTRHENSQGGTWYIWRTVVQAEERVNAKLEQDWQFEE